MSIQAEIVGGLGNQLFIVATMLAISKKHNIPYKLKKVITSSITPRSVYWDIIFSKLNYVDTLPNVDIILKESSHNHYNEFDLSLPFHYKIDGYFQTSCYFNDIKDEIDNLFTLTESNQSIVDKIWDSIKIKTSNQNVNFIHIRRGDYVHLQHFHFLLTIEWYKRSIEHFGKNDFFIIFSDDIQWCEQQFSFLQNKQFINENDYISLFLMAKCDGAIIANSSFSWWGAYLGKKKKVVCPDIWFTDRFPQQLMRNEPDWINEKVI